MQKLGVLTAILSAFLSASAYDFEADGIYYNITDPNAKEVEITYERQNDFNPKYVDDIVVPSSVSYDNEQYTVTAIGDEAFRSCYEMTSITIPNSVTTIGDFAFGGCRDLASITIPNTITSIGAYAFHDCGCLASISIPNSVTTIEKYTFSGCTNLTSITIPNSVTAIEENAFASCVRLSSITIPNSVTTINSSAFWHCSSLTSITIPNSVVSLGRNYSLFSGCLSLTNIFVDGNNQTYSSIDGILYDKLHTRLIRCPEGKSGEVIIPNFVTAIDEYAFWSCSSLTSITIPNSVTIIGKWGFHSCRGLTTLTSLAATPPTCGLDPFDYIDKEICTLYVPAESIEAYKQAPEWKDFVLVKKVESGIDSIVESPTDATTEVFDLTGVKVANSSGNLPAGIYLVRKGSTVTKITVR